MLDISDYIPKKVYVIKGLFFFKVILFISYNFVEKFK